MVAPSSEPEERPRSGEAIGKKIERVVQLRHPSGQFRVRQWAETRIRQRAVSWPLPGAFVTAHGQFFGSGAIFVKPLGVSLTCIDEVG